MREDGVLQKSGLIEDVMIVASALIAASLE
jgi:hypothetical protein